MQALCRAGGEYDDCWITGRSRGGPRTARTTGLGAFLGTQGNSYVQQKYFNILVTSMTKSAFMTTQNLGSPGLSSTV